VYLQVPDKATFRLVVKVLKQWAKARGIYSNSLGYLGAINLALIVALVCLMYLAGVPSFLLLRAFKVPPPPMYISAPVTHVHPLVSKRQGHLHGRPPNEASCWRGSSNRGTTMH